MNCICPKCTAHIEQDHTQIPAEGTAIKCPACKTRVMLIHESFARMAYYKAGAKNCSNCGAQLGHTFYCPSCHNTYPSFYASVDHAAFRNNVKAKQRQRFVDFIKLPQISLPSFKSSSTAAAPQRYTPERITTTAKSAVTATNARRFSTQIISLIVFIVIMSGGYVAYARYKTEQLYLDTYFQTLYGIKGGVDYCTKIQGKMIFDWKSAQQSGQSFKPRVAIDEESRLIKVKNTNATLLQQLQAPAEKYIPAKEKLEKLNETFTKIQAMTLTPPATLATFMEDARREGELFSKQAKELKASLPDEMTEGFVKAKEMYKSLKDI